MNNTQLNYLKTVLISQLLLEANDQLKMTIQYKQNVKNQINKLDVMLEEVVREEYVNLYNTDPEMVTNILNRIESLIDKLVMIEAVVDKYQENKEWFTEHASAEFLKID